MRKRNKKLSLNKETLKDLGENARRVVGGTTTTCGPTESCTCVPTGTCGDSETCATCDTYMCTYECDTDTTYPGCGGGTFTHPCE
jgi:hypothetical protein